MEDAESIFTRDLLIRVGIEVSSISIFEHIVTAYKIDTIPNLIYDTKNNYDEYSFLVIPGGKYVTQVYETQFWIRELILKFRNKNKLICAICAAPLFLSDLNILGKYTCFKGIEKLITSGKFTNSIVEYDNNIITAKSAGFIIEFASKIVEVVLGKEEKEKLLKQILILQI
jgi:4-methyl-5(b-hydroxyethyl)-thiazole monophosphate biosynthesis